MRKRNQQAIDAIKYLQSRGMEGKQLNKMHHLNYPNGSLIKRCIDYFDRDQKITSETNIKFANRVIYAAAIHKQGEATISSAINATLRNGPS